MRIGSAKVVLLRVRVNDGSWAQVWREAVAVSIARSFTTPQPGPPSRQLGLARPFVAQPGVQLHVAQSRTLHTPTESALHNYRNTNIDITTCNHTSMPGKHIADASEEPCRRCKGVSVLVVRSEPLCQSVIRHLGKSIRKRIR